MKAFVNSIPKSGTYLVRELLESLGCGKSHLHISERGTYDYSKITFEEGRRTPQKCLVRQRLLSSLNNIPNGSFAVGHLKYKSRVVEALKPFNIIFLCRAPKQTIISYLVYNIETGRALRDPYDKQWLQINDPQQQFVEYIKLRGERLLTTYKQILPWKDSPNVHTFDFNQLKSNRVEETQRLAEVVGKQNRVEQTLSAFEKKTQTLSKTDTTKFWSQEAHDRLDHIINKLGIIYDY